MSFLNPLPTAKDWKMTETLLKVTKNMRLLNPPAYSTGVVNDCNITESGIKHEPPDPPCLHQRSGK